MKDSGSNRKLGWSIEGVPLQKDPSNPNRITKALITHVALTWSPKNHNTFADIVKGIQQKDYIELDYDIPADVDYLYKGVFGGVEYTLNKDFTITKAMEATHETGQQLVGKDTHGAALKAESLDDDLKVLTIPIASVSWVADNWENFKEDTKKALRKAFHGEIVKARSGVYGDTEENRKLGRVGQKYGNEKAEKELDWRKNKQGEEKEKKGEPGPGEGKMDEEDLREHAKQSSEGALQGAIKQSSDPTVRKIAHEELQRRQDEEHPQKEKKEEFPSKELGKKNLPETSKEDIRKESKNEYGETLKELQKDEKDFKQYMQSDKFGNLDEYEQDRIERTYENLKLRIKKFSKE